MLARAALAAGDVEAAAGELNRARSCTPTGAHDVRARIDAVAAHVALTRDDVSEAGRLAAAAVEGAARLSLPEVECEALEILGRITEDWPTRIARFQQAAELAERHGLESWRLRALHELALTLAVTGDLGRLGDVRRLAAESGAFVTVAQMDLLLADLALGTFDHDVCLEAARRCVDASRRYGLASLSVALLWLAGAHALGGREADMEAVLAEAIELDPGDPRVLADAWGKVRATRFALNEGRTGLRDALERSMEYTRIAPETSSIYPGQWPWALLRAMSDDDLGRAARAEVSGGRFGPSTFGRPRLALIDAVILGREGRVEEATRTATDAEAALTGAEAGTGTWSMYLFRLASEAAIRDGWGDPVGWLRQAEAYFAVRGYERVVRECRALLRAAGAPETRRGRGESEVPPALRKTGSTSRELDVLRLVGEGLSTRDIADRLVLSPRTVEHHVSRLLTRTGLRSRTELAEFWHANRVAVPP